MAEGGDTPIQERIDLARQGVQDAEAALRTLVADVCPGQHHPVQHRDRRPPWCRSCGRTSDGTMVREPEAGP